MGWSTNGEDAFICWRCREGFASKEEAFQKVHAQKRFTTTKKRARSGRFNVACVIGSTTRRGICVAINSSRTTRKCTCESCAERVLPRKTPSSSTSPRTKHTPEFPCPTCIKKYKHESNVRNCIVRDERPKQHRCKISQTRTKITFADWLVNYWLISLASFHH